jgi:hypothetical protein
VAGVALVNPSLSKVFCALELKKVINKTASNTALKMDNFLLIRIIFWWYVFALRKFIDRLII